MREDVVAVSEQGSAARSAWLATGFMLVVAVLNAMDAVIVRLLAGEVHAFLIGFFRSVFGLMVMLPWILRRVDLAASPYRALHVLRAGLKLASLIFFFIAYQTAPLSDVTAINFSMPIFLMLGAWAVLGEHIGPARVIAIAGGLVGMLIVIRPGAAGFDPALLWALAGAALTAVIQLMLKVMSRRDTAERLVAWNLISAAGLGALLALLVWQTPTPVQLALLFLQGALGVLNQTLVTKALSIADASFIAPLDFLRLPVVALLAFLVFGEVAALSTWVGAAIIFGSTLVTAGAARRLRTPSDP
jgi:drug/metabolite transporter (DMT)-like permease